MNQHSSDKDPTKSSVEETVIFEGAPPTGLLERPKNSLVGPGLLILVGCLAGLILVLLFFR